MASSEAIAQFLSFTGATSEEAAQYIEMAGGDVEQAVNLFIEMGGNSMRDSPVASPATRPAPYPQLPSGAGGIVDHDVAAEVAAAAAAAGIDLGPRDAEMHHEEVRAPIAAYEDQIINPGLDHRMQEEIAEDAAGIERRMSLDCEELNKLLAAPEFNNPAPYYKAMEEAKRTAKWLIVNIQQAENFSSFELNRDVWRNETIKECIEGGFVFWQRDDKSKEGEQFCLLYNCGHQLPHICIIDPRTGRRVKGWDGKKWIEAHAATEYLFGFLDEFSMERPPVGSPVAKPSSPPQVAGDVVMVGLPGVEGEGAASSTAAATAVPLAEAPEEKGPQERAAEMPVEPDEAAEHLKVSLRLPSGQSVARRFRPDDKVEQMFFVASALAEQPVSRIDLKTQFPRRSLRDGENPLAIAVKDANVAGSVVLVSVVS